MIKRVHDQAFAWSPARGRGCRRTGRRRQGPSDLIADTKAQPGKVACASLGPSTLGYLLTRQFELIAGLKMIDAPYKCAAAAYPDLMNGTVAVMLDSPSARPAWCATSA